MRVPCVLPADSIAPYLACKAALQTALGLGLESLGFPGLGTGTGRVPAERCAFQMRAGIDEVLFGKAPFPGSLGDAARRHEWLAAGG